MFRCFCRCRRRNWFALYRGNWHLVSKLLPNNKLPLVIFVIANGRFFILRQGVFQYQHIDLPGVGSTGIVGFDAGETADHTVCIDDFRLISGVSVCENYGKVRRADAFTMGAADVVFVQMCAAMHKVTSEGKNCF